MGQVLRSEVCIGSFQWNNRIRTHHPNFDIQGASVIVPTHTFFATVSASIMAGCKVIFADPNPETLCIDLDSIKKVIRPDTKAIILVHIGGVITPDIEEIVAYCKEKEIFLVEDAAHAHGATHNNKKAGSFGDASAFSFHHSKVLTTGEGGMITTDNHELAAKYRTGRALGIDHTVDKLTVLEVSSNSKLSELSAVLGLCQMRKADQILAERRALAALYEKFICDDACVVSKKVINGQSAYYKYIVFARKAESRDKILKTLEEKYSVHCPPLVYQIPCTEQPAAEHDAVLNNKGEFPNTRYIRDHHICLPMYNSLKPEEVKYIASALNEIGIS